MGKNTKSNISTLFLIMSYWWLLPFIVTELTSENALTRLRWLIEIIIYFANNIMILLVLFKIKTTIWRYKLLSCTFAYVLSLVTYIAVVIAFTKLSDVQLGAEHSLLMYYVIAVAVNTLIGILVFVLLSINERRKEAQKVEKTSADTKP